MRLGALGRAFSKRSEQTRVSHEVHQIALATFGLTDALDTVRCAAVPPPCSRGTCRSRVGGMAMRAGHEP